MLVIRYQWPDRKIAKYFEFISFGFADTGDPRLIARALELCESRGFDMGLEDDDSDDRDEDNERDVQSLSEDDEEAIIFGDGDDGDRVFQLEVASIMEGTSATVLKTEAEQTLDSIVE